MQQPDQAVTHLKKAVELHPNFARAYFDLGLVYQHQKNLDAAKTALKKAMEIYPRFADAQLNLAFTYDQLGEREQAISAYQAVLKDDPKQLTARFKPGDSL